MTESATLRRILTQYKQIAVVGLSANRSRPSHSVAAYLLEQGLMRGDCLTVTGQTIAEVLADVPVRLARGEIDAGFMLEDPGADDTAHGAAEATAPLSFRPLTRFSYRVVAPAGWQRRVAGLDWAGLARLPWIGTPPRSIHARLLERRFAEVGAVQHRVALVDQEPSMLAMVRSGVGLSLCREAIALHEGQAGSLTIVGEIRLPAVLGFSIIRSRSEEPALALALQTLERIWATELMAPRGDDPQ